MKTKIALALAGVLAVTAFSANAISEAYRKQLERSHTTQVQDAQGSPSRHTVYTYADDIIEAQIDDTCTVLKVNGFPPTKMKHISKELDEFETEMDVTLSVLLLPGDKCDVTWTNKSGQSGILTIR
ncbi:hypothetical protein D7B12_17745 [Salmonella enterica]|nr:hypothetical protein [Salmonella enterica]